MEVCSYCGACSGELNIQEIIKKANRIAEEVTKDRIIEYRYWYLYQNTRKILDLFWLMLERYFENGEEKKTMREESRYRFQYLCSCINIFEEVENDYDSCKPHPFMNGGIPLSKEARKNIRGIIRTRTQIIPLFRKENERLNRKWKKSILGQDNSEYDCHKCGQEEFDLNNSYYKRWSVHYQEWFLE